MNHFSFPLIYWFDALATASYLINRHPTLKLNNLTPYEVVQTQT